MIDDFKCEKCGKTVELMYKRGEEDKQKCKCGNKLVKKISAPTVKFVGAGWETNDRLDFWADTREKQKELCGGDFYSHKDSE